MTGTDLSAMPPLPSVATLLRRLAIAFPEGSPHRANAIGERAARTAFVMLYIGAVEGRDDWLRPDQVTRMTDAQASRTDETSRRQWAEASRRPLKSGHIEGRWYQVNSREGIRDDTLRSAWLPTGAVVRRKNVATTSSRPTWALAQDFAELLTYAVTPGQTEAAAAEAEQSGQFQQRVEQWQQRRLSRESMARVQLVRRLTASTGMVTVEIPRRGPRHMAPGRSSMIAKEVVETFAPRFLADPVVLWLSESGNQSPLADADLAAAIGLNISDSGILPDVILADIAGPQWILVFIEIVATDGPMNDQRKAAICTLTDAAGFDRSRIVLLTAYLDRDSSEYRKTASHVAWGTMSWIASEPENLILHLGASKTRSLASLLPLI